MKNAINFIIFACIKSKSLLMELWSISII